MKDSAIEWTHGSYQLWIGCARVSAGCERCYAEGMSERFWRTWQRKGWELVGDDGAGKLWGRTGPRLFPPASYRDQLAKWNAAAGRAGERRRVFVNSMSDFGEDHPSLDVRTRMKSARQWLFEIVEELPFLDLLLLTKRPDSFCAALPGTWRHEVPPNVWPGFTAENQHALEARFDVMGELPTRRLWLSWEPAVGPLDLAEYLPQWPGDTRTLDWVVAGSESGAGARFAPLEWFERVQRQCKDAAVPFFFKQWRPEGARAVVSLPALGGQRWAQFPEMGGRCTL